MSAAIAAAGIGAATSIGMGVANSQLGKKADSKAQAAQHQQNILNMKMLNAGREEANAALQPWVQSGQSANQQMTDYLNDYKPYGMQQYKKDPGYTPMVNSLEELQQTPGYMFQLEQGQQAIDNSAAARGSLLSGRQLKATNDYAQNVASTGYQSAWERAQRAYQSAFDRNQSQGLQRFSQLAQTSQQGLGAAGQQGSNTLNAFGNIAGGNIQSQNNLNTLSMEKSKDQQGGNNTIATSLQDLLGNKSVQSGVYSLFNNQQQPYDNINNAVGAQMQKVNL
jgi:hypothetical protein